MFYDSISRGVVMRAKLSHSVTCESSNSDSSNARVKCKVPGLAVVKVVYVDEGDG